MPIYAITTTMGKKKTLGSISLNYARYLAMMDIIRSLHDMPVKVWEDNNGQVLWIGTVFRDEKGKIRWSATNNPKEISVLINNDGSLRKKAVKSAYGIKGKLRPFGL